MLFQVKDFMEQADGVSTSDVISGENSEVTCDHCGKNLSHMNFVRQTQHIRRSNFATSRVNLFNSNHRQSKFFVVNLFYCLIFQMWWVEGKIDQSYWWRSFCQFQWCCGLSSLFKALFWSKEKIWTSKEVWEKVCHINWETHSCIEASREAKQRTERRWVASIIYIVSWLTVRIYYLKFWKRINCS